MSFINVVDTPGVMGYELEVLGWWEVILKETVKGRRIRIRACVHRS